jgi:hypothetical protein
MPQYFIRELLEAWSLKYAHRHTSASSLPRYSRASSISFSRRRHTHTHWPQFRAVAPKQHFGTHSFLAYAYTSLIIFAWRFAFSIIYDARAQ